MKPIRSVLALCCAVAAGGCAQVASIERAPALQVREQAPPDGWAAQAGGTRGGVDAPAANVFTVGTAAQLRSALGTSVAGSRIVQVDGIIDMSEGRTFADHADQSRRGRDRKSVV